MKKENKFYINNQDGFYWCVNVWIIIFFSIFTIFLLLAWGLWWDGSRYIALLALLPGSIAYLWILSFSHRKISIEIWENELFINIPQKKYSRKISRHSFKFNDILNVYWGITYFYSWGRRAPYILLLIHLKNWKKISLKWQDQMRLRSEKDIFWRGTLLEKFLNELENKGITILKMSWNQKIYPLVPFSCNLS